MKEDYNENTNIESEDRVISKDEIEKNMEGLARMSKTVKESIVTVERKELRNVVDAFYQTQKFRIQLQSQVRALIQGYDATGNTETVMQWALSDVTNLENQLNAAISNFTGHNPVCRWSRSNIGVGPLITGLLYAMFDVEKCSNAGQFWSYAGLNDNNNPWLGTEKAGAMVKELISDRDIIMKIIDKKVMESFTKTKYEKISKIFNTIGRDNGDFEFTKSSDINMINEITGILDDTNIVTSSDVMEYIVWRSDTSLVHPNRIAILGTKYLHGRRSVKVLLNGSVERKEGSKHIGFTTVSSLKAYLAKPPYNTRLKQTMWKLGASFVKQNKKENSLYGTLYRERKMYESMNNLDLKYKDQADAIMASKNLNMSKDSNKFYAAGMLPPKHLDMRARRYVEKIFVSHLFECMYIDLHHEYPQYPYPISRLGHVDYIAPENPYSDFLGFECKMPDIVHMGYKDNADINFSYIPSNEIDIEDYDD